MRVRLTGGPAPYRSTARMAAATAEREGGHAAWAAFPEWPGMVEKGRFTNDGHGDHPAGEWHDAPAGDRHPHDIAGRPARAAGADRRQEGLRSRPVRRLHRPA